MDTFNAQRIARTEHEMRLRSIPPVPEDVMWERDEQPKSRRGPLLLLRAVIRSSSAAIISVIFRP